MDGSDIILNGEIILEGDVLPHDFCQWMDTGCFSARMVREALSSLGGDVTVRVNSGGGSPYEGEAIRAAFEGHEGKVTVIIGGIAASAASLMIMSADRIEMTAGSFLMIHNPSSCLCGTADDLRKEATDLDGLAQVYAQVYAARAGTDAASVMRMMNEETYFGPDAAVEVGFVDAVVGAANDNNQPDIAAFVSLHQRSVVNLRMCAQKINAAGEQPAAELAGTVGHQPAMMATTMENPMDIEGNPAVENTTNNQSTQGQTNAPQMTMQAPPDVSAIEERGRQAERARQREIREMSAPFTASGQLTEAQVSAVIDEGVASASAANRFMSLMAESEAPMAPAGGAARINRDEAETRREGLALAMTARILNEDTDDARARPYMGLSVVEMAATAMGRTLPRYGSYAQREEILMQGLHTTSDFPSILSTSINRVLETQYELVDRTFTAVSREMEFNDFRTHDIVRPDEFPSLQKVNEAGEIKFGSLGDSKETVALAAYATGIGISRQALVNDDLGAIQDVIDNAAAIVPEFEEDVFWNYYLSNPTLADGVAMYHSNHGNLASSGSAISVASVAAGRKALRTMKSADGKRTIKMNAPTILLVGPENETAAEQFLKEVGATKTADVNPFTGRLRPVVTEAITDTQWYLLVGPEKRTHNVKHGYLRDRRAPRVRVDEPFGVQGMRMTLEQDFGVGGVNHRGGYKNAGS